VKRRKIEKRAQERERPNKEGMSRKKRRTLSGRKAKDEHGKMEEERMEGQPQGEMKNRKMSRRNGRTDGRNDERWGVYMLALLVPEPSRAFATTGSSP
jgi:hypothetical protein